ncbi:GIY-YIG nuclease family protein [Mesorhizobium sp. DCY119]|uniref:GIY-YIG nuclease family protein n=1 Tax=Mesorhizobium sp. DCY119 TaxID=2108445 RepID=UPI001FDF3B27|nr:GIY-YIG nuclease family protein [Mesorhizobium sp. DCY119]
MSSIGRSVRLFLVDGNPSGIITAEVVNWTGHALVAPRSKLSDILTRSETQKTGVYFLFGELAELGGRRPVYIGESDNVGRRISQHVRSDEKDFEKFCLITSKDLNLTKAHARYLENRFSIIAKESDRADVLNSIEPALGILPESDIADMEYFIEQVRIILPVLGYDVLKDKFVRPIHLGKETVRETESEITLVPLKLRSSRKGLIADAVEREGEILVLKDSLADRYPDYAMNQYQPLRERLEREGTLVPEENGQFLRFTKDTLFSSPSAAAAVIYGRNANGRTSWVLANMNKTLKAYQDELQAAQ